MNEFFEFIQQKYNLYDFVYRIEKIEKWFSKNKENENLSTIFEMRTLRMSVIEE